MFYLSRDLKSETSCNTVLLESNFFKVKFFFAVENDRKSSLAVMIYLHTVYG